jgi:hypothetical protein
MIHLTKGQENTIFTTSDTTLTLDYYYFKFTNRTTQDVVEMWLANESDKERFQKYTIITSDFFGNFIEGFWTYTIQIATAYEVVPTTAILESGYMLLHPENEFVPTKYSEQSNNFTAYNGQL